MALSPILFKERLTFYKIVGFSAVFTGIFLVNGASSGGALNGIGLFCGLMSAVMYSFMVIFNKKALKVQGLENSAIQLAAAFLTVAVFVGLQGGYPLSVGGADFIWVMVLGLVNTGIGCYFYFSSIGRLPVQTVAICGYLEPLSAVLLAAAILHERMQPLQMAGAVCIIGGAVLGELGGKKKI